VNTSSDPNALIDQWIAVYEDEQRHGADHRRILATLYEIRAASRACPSNQTGRIAFMTMFDETERTTR
jgi:hypothetical protein